jgi:tetratricopeptide (TPR) repeat protein
MAHSIRSGTEAPIRFRALAAALALSLLASGLPQLAGADEPPAFAGDDERALAKAHFKLGRGYQDARAYEKAIIEYQTAYAIAPMPELLFNIGQCYRLSGEPRMALLYYQRYLSSVPEGGASDEARAHVLSLRARIAAHPGQPTLLVVPTPPPSVEDGTPSWRWIGAGTAFAGLVTTGVGFYYGLEAHDASQQLEDAHGPFTPELARLQRDGREAQTRMLVLTGVGVTLMTAGGLTWWLSRADDEPHRMGATPVVGPGQAGFAVFGDF